MSVAGRSLLSEVLFLVGLGAVGTVAFTLAVVWRISNVDWGGLIWLSGFYVMSAIRAPHVLRSAKTQMLVKRSDWLEWLLLTGVAVTGVALPFVSLATDALNFADYSPSTLTTGVGAILLLPSLWLLWRSHVDLEGNWSPSLELREKHTLITHGVYHFVRHPMYASIWLWFIAQALLVHNWVAGAGALPVFAMLYFIRVPREEQMLRERFGAAYRSYAGRTGRVIPKLGV